MGETSVQRERRVELHAHENYCDMTFCRSRPVDSFLGCICQVIEETVIIRHVSLFQTISIVNAFGWYVVLGQ